VANTAVTNIKGVLEVARFLKVFSDTLFIVDKTVCAKMCPQNYPEIFA
jgi:hypothetical protein